jgi:hypothetical protein
LRDVLTYELKTRDTTKVIEGICMATTGTYRPHLDAVQMAPYCAKKILLETPV